MGRTTLRIPYRAVGILCVLLLEPTVLAESPGWTGEPSVPRGDFAVREDLLGPLDPRSSVALASPNSQRGVPTAPSYLYACAELSTASEIRLFNPDVTIVSFDAQWLDATGHTVERGSASLLPGQQIELSTLIGESTEPSWLKISASGRLSGQCTIVDKRNRSAVLALQRVFDRAGIVAPRMLDLQGSRDLSVDLWLTVANAGAATTLRLVPRGADGRDLTPVSPGFAIAPIRLAAGTLFSKKLTSWPTPVSEEVAWVEIDSPGQIAGSLRLTRRDAELAVFVAPSPDAGGTETGLLFDIGSWSSKSFTLVNPATDPSTVDLEVLDGDGLSLARRVFVLSGKAVLVGRIDPMGMQVQGRVAGLVSATSVGIDLPGSEAARVRAVRLRAASPFVVTRLNRGARGALEGFVPAGASDHLSFASGPPVGTRILRLNAAKPGQAVVRIHDSSGRETFRETLHFDGPATRELQLSGRSIESHASVVVSVVGEPTDIALAAVFERTALDRACTILTPACGPLSETLPQGEALNRPPDPQAIPLRPVWDDWVRANHQTIASLASNNLEDLQFLEDHIGDRRIVQLGESSHGTAEFSSIKVRMIKFLHQQMGFEVIAFESGFFECEWTQTLDPDLYDAELHMYASIFGVWHSHEALELFAYIRESKRTPRPLLITGFDPQWSSGYGAQNQAGFLRELFEPLDPEFAEQLFTVDSGYFANSGDAAYLRANGPGMTQTYEQALTMLENDLPSASEQPLPSQRIRKLATRVLRNNLARIELDYYWLVWGRPDLYSAFRDRVMAENVEFLADELYPGKRIAIWAHDAHIRYDEPNIPNGRPHPSMGWHLAQSRRDELYTVGISMYRGSAAWNNREVYQVKPPYQEESVETIGYATERKLAFIDLLSSLPEQGNSWMESWLSYWSWGFGGPYPMIPRDNCDALLFVDESHPPSYTY